ncbi:MAG: hypothetical protein KDC02_25705, partial [Flavobacteriales bacterium]|nr:hypothetical protein [Flavobacteriales bacterium]
AGPEGVTDEQLHEQLAEEYPQHAELVAAIQAYERFARGLEDAFHRLFVSAQEADVHGFPVAAMQDVPDFRECVDGLSERYTTTLSSLGDLGKFGSELQGLFHQRFHLLGEHMLPAQFALRLCEHHTGVQRAKSAAGKRTWFDPLGEGRIHIRAGYRVEPRENRPGRYVHAYRGAPIARFIQDLS